MPSYIFQNQDTEEFVEIIQGINEKHEYLGKNGDESCWKRVFTTPNLSTDGFSSNIDPFSKDDFKKFTENKKGKVGDVMDLSAEMSERRKQKFGIDPVKQKFFDDYAKKRNGKRHALEGSEKSISKNGITVKFDK